MAFVVPLAVGIGTWIGAHAALSFSVAWLVGGWLFGPKADSGNNIIDPGAQEMPRFNQALRGVTMPVMFGTNRVASNIVWVKNFQTVRSESTTGSGGKAGGSGGGKAPSGPTNVSYTYKWDILMHVGMTPASVALFGGWVNASKMDNATVLAIATGAGNVAIVPNDNTQDDVGLSFDDSYFGQAEPTGSVVQTAWPYFATQEGAAARWPYTTYIGFQALVLGSSPSIPQLSWEIGPGQAQITYSQNTTYATTSSVITGNGSPTGQHGQAAGAGYLVGLDGHYYMPYMATSDTTDAVLQRLDSNAQIKRTRAQFQADANARGLSSAAEWTSFAGGPIIIPIGDTDRFWCLGLANAFPTYAVGILYSIQADGTLAVIAGLRIRIGSALHFPLAQYQALGWGKLGVGSNDDEVVAMFEPGAGGTYAYLLRLPKYNTSTDVVDTTASAFDAYISDLTDLGTNWWGPASSTKRGNAFYPQQVFFLPTAYIGILGVSWTTRIMITRSFWEATYEPTGIGAGVIATADAANPSGYVLYREINANLTYYSGTSSWQTFTGFVDASGATLAYPFSDDHTEYDGSTPTSDTGYIGPSVQRIDATQIAYAWAVLWPKFYKSNATNQAGGVVKTTVRFFVWDAFNKVLKQYASQSGSFATVTSATDALVTVQPFYDQTQGKLQIVSEYFNNDEFVVSQFATVDIGGATDVTPAYIVYQILTHPAFGAGITAAQIDQTSYAAAAAYCEALGIKVSCQYNREDNLLSVLEELLAIFNCFLVVSGGTIKFCLQDFSTASVRTLDNHHFVVDEGKPPVKTIHAARQDSFNKVRVNYFDRNLSYRQNQVEVSDEVDMDLTGTRLKEFQPRFVMTESLANMIATRALWTNLYARDTYQFSIGPKDQDLEPGDAVTLVDSFDTQLSGGKRVRIGRVQQTAAAKWDITAVVELEYTQNSSLLAFNASSPTSRGNIVGGVGPPFDFRAYELPQEFQGAATQVLFGYNPSAKTQGARLYISPDGTTYGRVADIQPFVINGIFADALPLRERGYMETNVQIFLSPDQSSGFVSSSPVYVQTYAIDDVSETNRELGLGLIVVGSEMMAYENLTLLGQNNYRIGRLYRGWGGTAVSTVSSGAYWHKHGGGVLAVDLTTDKVGTNFYYKVAPYNFNGVEYDISSIVAKQWTVKDWPVTPQAVGDISTFVTSPGAVSTQSVSLPSNGFRNVIAGGCDVVFKWSAASRTTGFGTGGYGKGDGGYGRFTRDVTTPTYRVEVLSGNTMIRSTTVNTEAFTYTLANNSADFNAWKGVFQLRVTPVNGYGAVPLSSITSINLF